MATDELVDAVGADLPRAQGPAVAEGARRRLVLSQLGWYVLLSALSLLVLFPIWMTIVRAVSEPFVYIQEGQPLYPIARSEEHTSELQSREKLVCRLLLEKK